jgi:hypothetical protein
MDAPTPKKVAQRSKLLLILAAPPAVLLIGFATFRLPQQKCGEHCDSSVGTFSEAVDYVPGSEWLHQANKQAVAELARQIERCPKAKTYTARYEIRDPRHTMKARLVYNRTRRSLRTVSHNVLFLEIWNWVGVEDFHIMALARASGTTEDLRQHGCSKQNLKFVPPSAWPPELN